MDLIATVRKELERGLSPSPIAALHACRLSRRSQPGVAPHRFVVNGPVLVHLSPRARIEMADGGRLFAGFGGTMIALRSDRQRGALVMLGDAVLRVRGRARLGYGTKVRVGDHGRLTLDDGARVGAQCLILAHDDVTIGAGAALSWGVTVMDSDLHEITTDQRPEPQPPRSVHIGAGALVGHDSLILPGVTIGAGAVVGARSVVTRDVEPGSVVAGSPARRVATGAVWH